MRRLTEIRFRKLDVRVKLNLSKRFSDKKRSSISSLFLFLKREKEDEELLESCFVSRRSYGVEKSIKLNRSFRALLRGKRGGAFKGERRKEVW